MGGRTTQAALPTFPAYRTTHRTTGATLAPGCHCVPASGPCCCVAASCHYLPLSPFLCPTQRATHPASHFSLTTHPHDCLPRLPRLPPSLPHHLNALSTATMPFHFLLLPPMGHRRRPVDCGTLNTSSWTAWEKVGLRLWFCCLAQAASCVNCLHDSPGCVDLPFWQHPMTLPVSRTFSTTSLPLPPCTL